MAFTLLGNSLPCVIMQITMAQSQTLKCSNQQAAEAYIKCLSGILNQGSSYANRWGHNLVHQITLIAQAFFTQIVFKQDKKEPPLIWRFFFFFFLKRNIQLSVTAGGRQHSQVE